MPDHSSPENSDARLGVRGRFAPSPTGPLHFGSLVAALASYLDAKCRGGQWLVRMEDLDPPREIAGAADDILRSLAAHALEWDGTVAYQSERHLLYAAALERLRRAGLAYPCACSRREVADSALRGIEGPVYPGTCRSGLAPGRVARAWRLRLDDAQIEFVDENLGVRSQDVAHAIGDFVLLRADGLYAYQLAVVIDDAAQDITRVVRGADLIDSTERQIYLQRLLGLPTPAYLHVPVAVNMAGEKLSKQTLAKSITARDASSNLHAALAFLDQSPPPELARTNPREILEWAIAHWSPHSIARSRTRPAPAEFA